MFPAIFYWLSYARKSRLSSFRGKNTALNDENTDLILLTNHVLCEDTLY